MQSPRSDTEVSRLSALAAAPHAADGDVRPWVMHLALGALGFLAFFAMTDFEMYLRPEFGAALALLLMAFAGKRPWRELAALPLVWALGAFALFLIVHSAYVAWAWPQLAFPRQLSVAAKLLRLGVFCCVAGWWMSLRPRAIPYLLGLMVVGLVTAVLYYMPWDAWGGLWKGTVRPKFGIPENLSGQLAAVGSWLALCLVVGIWRGHLRGWRRRVLLALGLAAYASSFCVLMFSQSRGAWLAFATATPIAILGYWITSSRRNIRWASWKPILMAALISVLALIAARDMFALRFSGVEHLLAGGEATPAAEPGALRVAPPAATRDATRTTADAPSAPAAQAQRRPASVPSEAPGPVDEAETDADTVFPQLDTTVPSNRAVNIRMQLYELGVAKFKERPWLGWGLATIPPLIADAHLDMGGEHHVHLHNAYLDALVGMGLVGAGLLLLLFVLLARELLLAWKAGIISTASFWALAGCVGIVLVANNFDSLLWRFEYARAPLELLFGACVAYALMRRRAAAAHA